MKLPGFVSHFKEEVSAVSPHIREQINVSDGLHELNLLGLIAQPIDDRIVAPRIPIDTTVKLYHDNMEEYVEIGTEAIQKGEVAYCIVADEVDPISGMNKSMLRIPGLDMSLITLKMFQAVGTGPVVVVSSKQNNEKHRKHLSEQSGFDHSRIIYLDQYQSYALNPDYSLAMNDDIPLLHSCGPGDVFPLLAKHPLISQVKYVMIVDVANIFASFDPAIVGHHISSGYKVSCEVVRRKDDEDGKVLVDSAEGLQIAELSRVDVDNLEDYSWLCTNSYMINADVELEKLGKKWYRFKKEIKGRSQVQHKRVLEEITAAYDTAYVGVNRAERYIPVKSFDDLNIVKKIVNLNWNA